MKEILHIILLVLFLPLMVVFHIVGFVVGMVGCGFLAGMKRGWDYNPAKYIQK